MSAFDRMGALLVPVDVTPERVPRSVRALVEAVASIVLGRQVEVYIADPRPEVHNAPPETLHHDDFPPPSAPALARFHEGGGNRPVDPRVDGQPFHRVNGSPLPPLLDEQGQRICRTCKALLPAHVPRAGAGRPRNHCERCHPPKTRAA